MVEKEYLFMRLLFEDLFNSSFFYNRYIVISEMFVCQGREIPQEPQRGAKGEILIKSGRIESILSFYFITLL